jgi:hypothetical protein
MPQWMLIVLVFRLARGTPNVLPAGVPSHGCVAKPETKNRAPRRS